MVTLVFCFPTNVILLHQPIPDGSCSLDRTRELQLPTTEVRVPPVKKSDSEEISMEEKEVLAYFQMLC
jgi:hypothetical protein